MKCVCGYEAFGDENLSESLTNPSEPFIPLVGSDTYFEVPIKGKWFKRERVELFACPKCGTVRMEYK